MPANAYRNCIKIMKQVKEMGFEKQVIWKDLEKAIKIKVGASESVTEKYRKLLMDLDFIEHHTKNIYNIKEKSQPLY